MPVLQAIIESEYLLVLDYINPVLYYLLLYSNIISSLLFFYMGNRLISASERFEKKMDGVKIRLKKIENRCKYGTYVCGIFSGLFLFRIVPMVLLLIFEFLHVSPFLQILNEFSDYSIDYEKAQTLSELISYDAFEQFLMLLTATFSFLTFLSSILCIYTVVFRKIIKKPVAINLFLSVFFMVLAFIFGIPFMLKSLILS